MKMKWKVLVIGAMLLMLMQPVMAANGEGETKANIIIGCMLAVAIAGIASAIGLALAGSSAVAVTAEKPELFGKLLVLQVLPMTQSVYGLLTAILLMMGGGLLGGTAKVDLTQSWIGMAAIWVGLIFPTSFYSNPKPVISKIATSNPKMAIVSGITVNIIPLAATSGFLPTDAILAEATMP